jgi:hypothetical protein
MSGKMARSDPRPSVRATRGVGSGQHLASVLQEGRENANIDAGLGFIWRISGQMTDDQQQQAILITIRQQSPRQAPDCQIDQPPLSGPVEC